MMALEQSGLSVTAEEARQLSQDGSVLGNDAVQAAGFAGSDSASISFFQNGTAGAFAEPEDLAATGGKGVSLNCWGAEIVLCNSILELDF